MTALFYFAIGIILSGFCRIIFGEYGMNDEVGVGSVVIGAFIILVVSVFSVFI